MGINFHGFFKNSSGISQASRQNAMALKNAGVEIEFHNYYFENRIIKKDNDYHEYNSDKKNDFKINLFQINLNDLNDFFKTITNEVLKNKYNIAYWAWEFLEIPEEILIYLEVFDEIWVPSNFCVEAFSSIATIPVIRFMHPINSIKENNLNRSDFGLNDKNFIFLNIFDSISTTERKNPFGTIDAFNKAFDKKNENIKLIIKTFNLHKNKKLIKLFEVAVKANSNIILIDEDFSQIKIEGLIKNCNSLISLHRAEGFGLTMAEAMYFGKPVIATGYSGNLDYMNVNNSFLIKHDYMKLNEDCGILKKGYVMAEPNIIHAAQQMIFVYENNTTTIEINASKFILENLSIENIGNKMLYRLKLINKKLLQNIDQEKTFDKNLIENQILKNKINYLEKTIYNKIRIKINKIFSK